MSDPYNNNNSAAPDSASSASSSTASTFFNFGRQKLYDAVRATRETYIPTISKSISSNFISTPSDDPQLPFVPDDSKLILYKSYTRHSKGEYITDIRGWLFQPGLMNTKNRILFSLAQRLTKSNVNTQTMSQLQSELEESLAHPDTRDNDSNFSRSSTTDILHLQ
ncbi:unnamed protein product [[Candida] boidinii]|nr:unnamed protein product [[Candida] boidinii]GMF24708.1 unnamed protein product [[Candida] boidinii]